MQELSGGKIKSGLTAPELWTIGACLRFIPVYISLSYPCRCRAIDAPAVSVSLYCLYAKTPIFIVFLRFSAALSVRAARELLQIVFLARKAWISIWHYCSPLFFVESALSNIRSATGKINYGGVLYFLDRVAS